MVLDEPDSVTITVRAPHTLTISSCPHPPAINSDELAVIDKLVIEALEQVHFSKETGRQAKFQHRTADVPQAGIVEIGLKGTWPHQGQRM